MNTEQILKAATPRPWNVDGILVVSSDKTVIAYCGEVGAAKANQNLIVLAVNGYEAREALIADLVTALGAIKAMLGKDGEYSVCRTDGKKMGLPEVIHVGDIFEKGSAALAAAKAVQP